jgi:hypothetical protein
MSKQESQFPAIYRAAIRRFDEITNKKLDDPDILRIATIGDLIEEIDRRNAKFSKFCETRHMLFDVLESAMKPIEAVGDILASAASMAFPPSCLVFGAAAYLINAAKGSMSSYDVIQDLLATLKVECNL